MIDPTSVYVIMSSMIFALGLLFLLGMGNFALHKAVLESGHPLIEKMLGAAAVPRRGLMRSWTLLVEYVLLLAAMIITYDGGIWAIWVYGLYSALNIGSAWMVLTRRI